jgi:SPP1 gp7 family putative phage head morphogenesis protein
MGLFDFWNKKDEANAGNIRKAREIMRKVVNVQLTRFGQEINDWKNGLDSWEDVDNPQTVELVRVYNDLVLDPHLTAAMEARKARTLSKDFKICNEDGEEIPEESDIFNSLWFRDYIKYALDSRFYGYTVIQFGDRVGKSFDYIKIVPREYVYPQKMAVRQSPYSNTPIVPIKTGKYAAWTQYIGKRGDDLGLLSKAAPMMIYKKTTQGAWAEFCELFGAPFRLGKTDIRNDDLRENMYFMLENMGRNAYGVFSHDDELEFIGDKKTDAYEVYDKLIERANSEISKLILGSTMVMDEGSSRSQAEVHERTLGAIDKDDSLFIQEIVNNDLIPWLNQYHGFNITGYWKWDDAEKISKAEQFERDIKLIQTGKYNVPADYITETYGVPLEEVEDQEAEAEPENLTNSLEVKKKALSLEDEYFCNVCGVSHDLDNLGDEDVPPINWDEVTINDVINGVYSGKYTAESLPESVYFRIAKELTKGMDKGLSAVGKAADTYDKNFIRSLKHNAHVFSGAKTFQQVREMSDFIADNQGRRVPFKEYEAKAKELFNTYNQTWLKTEIFQAENSATMASKWQDIEEDKDILPMLKYQTVGDERVREDHRPLDGVTRPVDDPFWDTYYPPNGWRCRCEVLQEDEDEEATKLGGVKLPDVPPSMQINVGKKKVLFGPQHPYFIVEDQFKELKDNNFGLPIPKEAQIVEPKKIVKSKSVFKELKGFNGKWAHGTLKGDALETQGRVERTVNFEVPDKLFKSVELLNVLPGAQSGAHYNHYRKRVYFGHDQKRSLKDSNIYKYKVVSHEMGHALHYALEEITDYKTSKKFEALFNVMSEELKDIGAKQLGRRVKGSGLSYLDKELNDIRNNLWIKKNQIIDDVKKLKSITDDQETLGALADTIQGYSKGRYGWGHKKSYQKEANNGKMEIFAHLSENYFNGNKYFKKYLPKTYEAGIKYFDDILK